MPGGTSIDPEEHWVNNMNNLSFYESNLFNAQQAGKELIDYIHEDLLQGVISKEKIENKYGIVKASGGDAGDFISDFGGSPTKGDLLGKAKQTGIDDAFSEFIDNIIDNYTYYISHDGNNDDLKVEVYIDIDDNQPVAESMNSGTVVIKENSGGVPKDKLKALIQIGNSGWLDNITEAVGTWGNGGKVALATIGRFCKFQTYYWDSENNNNYEAIQMHFGDILEPHLDGGMNNNQDKKHARNYYHPENDYWKVAVNKAVDGHCIDNPGTSAITIKRLTENALITFQDPDKYNKMIARLQKIFYNKIRNFKNEYRKNIEIIFHNLRLECENNIFSNPQGAEGDLDKEKNNFVFLPGIKPIYHNCILSRGEQQIRVEILVGMPLKNPKEKRGFMLWGNGRLFDENFMDFDVPTGYPGWDKGNNVQAGRVKGFVKITGDPSLIPWKGPLKWKFNNQAVFAELLIQLLGSVITRYVTTSKSLGGAAITKKDGDHGPKFLRLFLDEEE